MLPESVFATLMALSEGEKDRYEIAASTGFHRGYLSQISQGMVSRGWIGTHYARGSRSKYAGVSGSGPRWWITERGKIVLAIECGRRTKARAKGILVGYEGSERVRTYRYA
jgi:hypothetical protein